MDMHSRPATDLLETLTQLPFVQRIWLFGARDSSTRNDHSRLSIAIDCASATLFDWQQIRAIISGWAEPSAIQCVRWDTLDASAPLRRQILHERILIYDAEPALL